MSDSVLSCIICIHERYRRHFIGRFCNYIGKQKKRPLDGLFSLDQLRIENRILIRNPDVFRGRGSCIERFSGVSRGLGSDLEFCCKNQRKTTIRYFWVQSGLKRAVFPLSSPRVKSSPSHICSKINTTTREKDETVLYRERKSCEPPVIMLR
jgi:hypothetical protein